MLMTLLLLEMIPIRLPLSRVIYTHSSTSRTLAHWSIFWASKSLVLQLVLFLASVNMLWISSLRLACLVLVLALSPWNNNTSSLLTPTLHCLILHSTIAWLVVYSTWQSRDLIFAILSTFWVSFCMTLVQLTLTLLCVCYVTLSLLLVKVSYFLPLVRYRFMPIATLIGQAAPWRADLPQVTSPCLGILPFRGNPRSKPLFLAPLLRPNIAPCPLPPVS